MKNKASTITLTCFVFGVSYFFFYFGWDFYTSSNAKWEAGLKKADSLEQISTLKEGEVGQIFLDVKIEKKREPTFGTPMQVKFRFKNSDSVFCLSNSATLTLRDSIHHAKIKFIANPETKEFDAIEFWGDSRKYYSAIDYLSLEKPLSGVSIFLIIAGSVFAAIGIFALRFTYQFVAGWLKLTEDIKMRYIEKKKISFLQLTLMKAYLKKWDENFIIYIITGVIMIIVLFFVPSKFLGLREMLRHAQDGKGNESIAEAIGYFYTAIGMAFIACLYLAEYVLGRQALKRDCAKGEMITMTGKVKGIFRDKKDGNQLKATITIGKMEFEEIEIAENHTFKKDQPVNVDLALQSLQVIGISHADLSR